MKKHFCTFQTIPRFLLGPGVISQIGFEAQKLGATHPLIITDQGVVNAGILDVVQSELNKSQLYAEVFSNVESDPSIEIVEQCLGEIKHKSFDLIIGLGGGSPMDIAKVISVMKTNEGRVIDYLAVDLIPKPGIPTIMVPTTAGTGSEATPIAVLSDESDKLKKGMVSNTLFPRRALLDSELTLSLPQQITAASGMDAFIHALEAYTSVNASPLSDMFARRAIELIFHNIRPAYAYGENLSARQSMLEGSLYAGIAFANAGVTAVHAFAYPIGAEFHIPHAMANCLMVQSVLKFNLLGNIDRFAQIASWCGEKVIGLSPRSAAKATIQTIGILLEDLKMKKGLREFGVTDADVPRLAAAALKVTRLLANNPRTITQKDAEKIYQNALS